MIVQTFSPGLVLLSYGVAFLGSYVAICLCEQLRTSYLHGEKNNLWVRGPWLLSIGVSLGGVGIWCMHFIGMSALRLHDDATNKSIDMAFDIGESIGSLIVVILLASCGVAIASNDRVFAKSRGQILEMFIRESSNLSMAEIKRTKDSKIIMLISTRELWLLLLGGLTAAAGVCIMHYIGMNAMTFGTNVTIKWDAGIIFASVLIALFAATAAFWILFRFLSIFPNYEPLRIACALIMGIAVCGMHYTGMVAATFEYRANIDPSGTTNNSDIAMDSIIPVAISALSVLWILVMTLLWDLHRLVHKYRSYIIRIKKGNPNANGNDSEFGEFSLLDVFKDEPKNKVMPVSSRSFTSYNIPTFKRAGSNTSVFSNPPTPSLITEKSSTLKVNDNLENV